MCTNTEFFSYLPHSFKNREKFFFKFLPGIAKTTQGRTICPMQKEISVQLIF